VLDASFLEYADYFTWLGGVDGRDLIGGFDAASADHEVVFAPELGANFLDGSAHLPSVFFPAEIGERFVLKRS
jgi:hypothetical protein